MILSISSSNIVVKRRKFSKKRIVTRNKQKFNPNLTMRFSLFWLPKTGQRRTLKQIMIRNHQNYVDQIMYAFSTSRDN